jgi:hypothetical protein
MNIRSKAILLALEYLDAKHPNEPLNIVEIGCMFWRGEGQSTYLVANFLSGRPKGGRFVSIDMDPQHIENCKQIINEQNPRLASYIEYRQGPSLKLLPLVLSEIRTIHCFLQDGGAHPEVCLVEFEIAMRHLSSGGIVLIDDAHTIAPTPAYPWPRFHGKATLILPSLILRSYINLRSKGLLPPVSADIESINGESELLRNLTGKDFPDIQQSSYAVIGTEQQLLLVGNELFITPAAETLSKRGNYQSYSEIVQIRLRRSWLWGLLIRIKHGLFGRPTEPWR